MTVALTSSSPSSLQENLFPVCLTFNGMACMACFIGVVISVLQSSLASAPSQSKKISSAPLSPPSHLLRYGTSILRSPVELKQFFLVLMFTTGTAPYVSCRALPLDISNMALYWKR